MSSISLYDCKMRKEKLKAPKVAASKAGWTGSYRFIMTNQEKYWRGSIKRWGGSRDYLDGVNCTITVPVNGLLRYTIISRDRDGINNQHSNGIHIFVQMPGHRWAWGGSGYADQRERERLNMENHAKGLAASFGWGEFKQKVLVAEYYPYYEFLFGLKVIK